MTVPQASGGRCGEVVAVLHIFGGEADLRATLMHEVAEAPDGLRDLSATVLT
ncbi:TetR family transcriptional regulator [Streptomyces hygroscopicus]|uniref:hypothetical protein n=1 Tax=unclassified Streptomyces TaxID=2593676 RepID=UPI0009C3373C|nr:hypothetical protein [Streptomyces sp. 11-1-2]AQW53292.1 TetR family transcriptional regulator [Streptomyces hygroscopicus]